MRILLPGLLVLALGAAASGQTRTPPPELDAVKKYILAEDYPEDFGPKRYQTKIEGSLIADLNGDGQSEVILQIMPDYRQSPTIVVYRIGAGMKVTRVIEGLAPGPLQPISGDYIDSHTISEGEGVDFSLETKPGEPATTRDFALSSLKHFGGVVQYRDFYHADARKGAGTFIDMTHQPSRPKDQTCEKFEFSKLKQIAAGAASGLGDAPLLAAWAQDGKVYLYRIKSFPASGVLDKQMWTVDVTDDFHGFIPGSAGPLSYVASSGGVKLFAVQCSRATCKQTP
jgi:hypothetical protein